MGHLDSRCDGKGGSDMGFVTIVALAASVFLYPGFSEAQVYRCEDGAGGTSYMDKPCSASDLAGETQIDSGISVLDRSGARRLDRQRSVRGQGSSSASQQVGEYQHQAQSLMAEARKVSETSARLNDSSIKSRKSAYAQHLILSARILESSTETSHQGIAAIRESNRIALNASNLSSAPSRSSLIRKATGLQHTAASHLGSPVSVVSSRPRQSSPSNTPPSGAIQPQPPISAPTRPQPNIITNCDSGGCWDDVGNRYNRGGGNTHFPATGGSCQLIGGMMRCP